MHKGMTHKIYIASARIVHNTTAMESLSNQFVLRSIYCCQKYLTLSTTLNTGRGSTVYIKFSEQQHFFISQKEIESF